MKVAVILGNRMNDDGTLSRLTLIRLKLAMEIIDKFKPHKVILSGGMANPLAKVTEASAMYDYLIKEGVPSDILIREQSSLTTKQNAKYCAPIIKELGADEVILCSSEEHIKRRWLNPVRIFKRALKGYNMRLIIYTHSVVN